jgi:hypothetical protein
VTQLSKDLLGPSLDVVHLSHSLGPVVLVDHGRHELLLVICTSPMLSAPSHEPLVDQTHLWFMTASM